jgi:hypothetical protein
MVRRSRRATRPFGRGRSRMMLGLRTAGLDARPARAPSRPRDLISGPFVRTSKTCNGYSSFSRKHRAPSRYTCWRSSEGEYREGGASLWQACRTFWPTDELGVRRIRGASWVTERGAGAAAREVQPRRPGGQAGEGLKPWPPMTALQGDIWRAANICKCRAASEASARGLAGAAHIEPGELYFGHRSLSRCTRPARACPLPCEHEPSWDRPGFRQNRFDFGQLGELHYSSTLR